MAAVAAGFAALFLLILLRLPIAFAMMLVGAGGVAALVGWLPALAMVQQVTFDTGLSYELSVVPLFVLMGNLVTRAGLSDELYAAAHAWLGHRRGGLAMATVVACGGFSAICGSSLATAATMARVAMPPMRRYGYADSLAAGAVAAGGTLGILIPPSVILVLYGIMTGQDIGALFAAGLLPGLLGIAGYVGAIAVVTWRDPALGPPAERTGWPARWRATARVWGVAVLFALVMGGIYGGVFTPTEAAGIGAGGGLAFALARRALDWPALLDVLVRSAETTAMLFFVLIGALMFANFVNLAGLPAALSDFVAGLDAPPLAVIAAIVAIYLVLGSVLESLSMVMLTVPVFYPLVGDLGLDLIWFGIVVVVVTEISLITPPIGLNVFVLRGVMPELSLATAFRGVTPFWIADIFRLAAIVLVPGIALLLPALIR
ncbi:MAG TPA: TRAP transporter large permease [Alphaproteobacteria bacterium]